MEGIGRHNRGDSVNGRGEPILIPNKKPKGHLNVAKSVKNDEFYTPYDVVENECEKYAEFYKGKTIYLNCDNPTHSQFYMYFNANFKRFGIKRLISSHYQDLVGNLFSKIPLQKHSFAEVREGDSCQKIPIKGDGDFRSRACRELMAECDVVITNPPFSLFRSFYKNVRRFKKYFLIIGPMTAVAYSDIFPDIISNKTRINDGGSQSVSFFTPNGDKNVAIYWYTNIPTSHGTLYPPHPMHEFSVFWDASGLKTFADTEIVCIDKIKDIPGAYDGMMGVPITFIEKYHPSQYKIFGLIRSSKETASYRKKYESRLKSGRLKPSDVCGENEVCPISTFHRFIIQKVKK